ncbi:MAG: T9SS type A sorting domain-containing protein, partial [Bacteroidia bacterium]|nr:T9SS type A sorting domain-containing protein [Bacteroidia bacterium]
TPSALGISSLLDTSVTLSWTENGTATIWDIEYDTTGFAVGTGNNIDGVTSNPYSLTGIMGNTTYDFYVRSDCGAGDTSLWVGPFSFTTFCSPVVAPWTEDFENSGNIPDCWLQGGANQEPWIFDTVAAHIGNFGVVNSSSASGGYFAYVDDSQPHNSNTLLVSPRIDISTLTEPELAFYVISNNEGQANVDFSIDVFDGTIWNLDFYTRNTNTTNNEWEEIVVDLSSITFTGNMQLRFTVDENNGGDFADDLSIDDVTIREAPSCKEPFALTASNITGVSADLEWSILDSATSWYVEYGPIGFTPDSGTFVLASSNPYNLAGLMPSTGYDFYVQSICGTGDSSLWVGPFSFTTGCLSVVAPWNEDFESGGIIPVCWSQDSLNNEPWLFDTIAGNVGAGGVLSGTTTSGNYFAYVDDSNPNSQNTGLLSPFIDITGLTLPELTYYVISNSGTGDNVDFSLDVWDGANWNTGFYTRNTNTLNGGWELITLYFTGLTITGDIQLRFTVSEQGGFGNFQDDIAIDDVDIHEGPPCPDPTDLTVTNITNSSADLGWLEIGSATIWDLQIDTSGFGLNTGSATLTVNSNPYTASGLMPNTAYDYYVRSNCGTDSSQWVGPFTFTTDCDPLPSPWVEEFENFGAIPNCWKQGVSNNESWLFDTTGAHVGNAGVWNGNSRSGGYFAFVDDSQPHSGQTTLISPMVDLSTLVVPELSFYIISNNEGNTNVDFSMDVWDGANWNVGFYTRNSNTLNGDWELIIISLSSLTITGDIRLRFVVDENNGGDFYDDVAIDDIDIREAPPCPQPSNITTSNVGATSVDVSWVENGSASMWNVIWGPTGFAISGTGTSVAATNYTITGLSSSTTYDVYVRSDCGADTSAWVGPISFTTGADYCAGDLFYDTGGPNGDYSPGEATITTICPTTPGEAVTVFFNQFETQNNADPLYVFNGPDTSSMLFDSGNPPTFGGFPAGGYYGNNIPGPFTSTDTSGCLTFLFLSNGFNNQAGWEAGVACGPPPCPGTVVLPQDTSICSTQTLVLDAGGAGAYTYEWSNGATTQTINVDSASIGGLGTYLITVYIIDNAQNCSDRDTIEVLIESCTDISELEASLDLNIYPNPTNGLFVIDINEFDGNEFYYSITDITGKAIYVSEQFQNQSVIHQELDLRDHSKGMYFITFESDKGRLTKKLVIH